MRPISMLNFGNRSGRIAVSFHNGTSVVSGHIVKQTGEKRYVVSNGSGQHIVTLAQTVDEATDLTAGLATIAVAPYASLDSSVVTYRVAAVAVADGGADYAIGDTLTVTGPVNFVATVATVDGNGAVLTVTKTASGSFTSLPGTRQPVARHVSPATNAAGSGAVLALTFEIDDIALAGVGYTTGQSVGFTGLVSTTAPTATVVATPDAITDVTITARGVGIVEAATDVTVTVPAEHVIKLTTFIAITAEGSRYYWRKGDAHGIGEADIAQIA